MVVVTGLSKRYGRVLALDDVSLRVAPGETYALLGPNGAGKSTLIHILCTVETADSGSLEIGGLDVAKRPRAVRRLLGVVFQEPSLDGRLTVLENLDFHGRIHDVPRPARSRRIAELLDLVELGEWRDKLVRTLSRGMQRRLELARALVHDSRLLVLDEPTVGLDAQTRSRMWEYLAALKARRDVTVLVTTHYIEEVEAADTVCVIDRGRVLASGTPHELKERHGSALARLRTEDPAVAAAVMTEHPDAMEVGGELVVPVGGPDEVASLLARHGTSLRSFTVVEPSLESVFLALTGRDLRDREADPRDRLLAFARSGGEHTR